MSPFALSRPGGAPRVRRWASRLSAAALGMCIGCAAGDGVDPSLADDESDDDDAQDRDEGNVATCPPMGDANLDGRFDTQDVVKAFAAGTYDTGAPAGWETGDWNGDGVFDSGDFVAAMSQGLYEGATCDMSAYCKPSVVQNCSHAATATWVDLANSKAFAMQHARAAEVAAQESARLEAAARASLLQLEDLSAQLAEIDDDFTYADQIQATIIAGRMAIDIMRAADIVGSQYTKWAPRTSCAAPQSVPTVTVEARPVAVDWAAGAAGIETAYSVVEKIELVAQGKVVELIPGYTQASELADITTDMYMQHVDYQNVVTLMEGLNYSTGRVIDKAKALRDEAILEAGRADENWRDYILKYPAYVDAANACEGADEAPLLSCEGECLPPTPGRYHETPTCEHGPANGVCGSYFAACCAPAPEPTHTCSEDGGEYATWECPESQACGTSFPSCI